MKIHFEEDAEPQTLKDGPIAVLGYGSQGRAHALNLRDSGYPVVIGLRPGGKTAARARADDFEVRDPADAAEGATLVAILTPDMTHRALFGEIQDRLAPRTTLLFAHGFSVHYKQVQPAKTHDIVLVAPKSPGDLVRRQFEAGQGVPCLMAIAQDATGRAHARTLAYAHAIGGTRSGVLETTFVEETETDLFGEQAVLCGGATELVVKGYETLVEAGYQPEVAYFECLHELKLIVDLLYEGGLAKMHQFVSETAKYGDLTRGPRIVDDHVKLSMQQILTEIRSGVFAREWIEENAKGQPRYRELLQRDLNHPIERVGDALRERMSWLRRQAAA
ncbi:MAG: ketol-acid reductoisomerase [Steroidobacteraceae bacterium]